MPVNSVNAALRYIRALIAGPAAEGQSDRYLLEQFVSNRDESAFAALLHRHGHMVLGVCMRVLHDEHLAEDALQATFLVLALKARKLRTPGSLAGWLYGVALRLARKVKAQDLRSRRQVEREMPEPPLAMPTEASRREEKVLLDEELERLPDKYRLPLLLCYFEGRTHEEAAAQLGKTLGQVKGLLDRGRERLRFRLIRRGVTPAAGLVIALSETARAATTVSPGLAVAIIQAAMNLVSGKTLAECGVSASVATLAKGGMSMYPVKMLLVLTALMFGAGATIWVASTCAGPQGRGPEQQVVGQQKVEQGDFDGRGDDKAEMPKVDKTKEELKALAGKWVCESSEVNGTKRDAKESKDQSMTFDGEKCVQEDAATSDNLPGTYQLDLSGKHKVMTMNLTVGMKEVTLRYIFERDGVPGGELPTEFTAPEGSRRVFMVLKREEVAAELQGVWSMLVGLRVENRILLAVWKQAELVLKSMSFSKRRGNSRPCSGLRSGAFLAPRPAPLISTPATVGMFQFGNAPLINLLPLLTPAQLLTAEVFSALAQQTSAGSDQGWMDHDQAVGEDSTAVNEQALAWIPMLTL